MIEIKANVNNKEVESFLTKINSDKEVDVSFRFPISQQFPPGISSLLIQLIITWVYNTKVSKLILPFKDSNSIPKLIDDVYINPHILTAILICEERCYYSEADRKIDSLKSTLITSYNEIEKVFYNISEVLIEQKIFNLLSKSTNSEEEIKLKKELQQEKLKVKKIEKKIVKEKNANFFLTCFDNIPRLQYPTYFYERKALKVKDSKRFKILLRDSFDKLNLSNSSSFFNKQVHSLLAEVFYELFDNTDSWAKPEDQNLIKSARGIDFKIFLSQIELENSLQSRSDELTEYIKNLNVHKIQTPELFDSPKSIGLCEISVFDSGIGLASHFAKKDISKFISLKEEYQAVLNCFKKNMTSDQTSTSSFRGFGLPKVVETIGQLGFLKIRTGHLSLYRDFNQSPIDVETEIINKNIHFNGGERHLAEIRGTLISVFYPFVF